MQTLNENYDYLNKNTVFNLISMTLAQKREKSEISQKTHVLTKKI